MVSVDADDVFADWEQDVDGLWVRRAARVIVVDGIGRVLLLQGFDVDEPDRTWWFTPGGGLDTGESERACAVRELFEETGLRLDPQEIVGPVAARSVEFRYFGRECRQHEVLFFAALGAGETAVRMDGWTAVERASMSDLQWWDRDELSATSETIYPAALAEIVDDVLARGWDGYVRRIG
ncbi:NUDIX domain-containing protein [Actinobacteria bacterium YIM 96077]|uniref:NUDIX hydrolase n=1 Tax=Phytoactinopolyspora halophila TaxID=1981511 RepID=A0A329QEX9_9ACTN|nr:NUDIX domain-containing protein [Phytoactinopolyspora halophila]AYY13473.1 NUDIX domain-containing protein [Actinobacteria bacterium YIM 96077]RAW10866.1 NUDIX hydrolase [Phytoactinopolyspora halophila]